MTQNRSKYRKLKQEKEHNLPLPSEEANKNCIVCIVELVGEALRRPIPQQGQDSGQSPGQAFFGVYQGWKQVSEGRKMWR